MGCQMNVYDSGQILSCLKPLGFEKTDDLEQADLVIVNTCTIREKAEQKAFSFLGRLRKLKKKKPKLMIGIGGCVAQQEGEKILSRMPYVDLVFGTHALFRLPKMIEKISATGCRIVDVKLSETTGEDDLAAPDQMQDQVTAFVTIMRGCDNYCTYCVVPYVRGRECSRHPDRIVEEIKGLVEKGVKEVTLLGQNVNSYGIKEGLIPFSGLLERVDKIDGLERIRFTTSHPKDLSDDLMAAFGTLPKLCNHIHLPVQSGSDRILKKMNRKYTIGHYLERIEALRAIKPDIAITTDIIAGFPGETQDDFEKTIDLLKTVQFDGIFAFIYSDRPGVPAAAFKDKLSEDEKKQRLQVILDLQERYTRAKNASLVGSLEKVLVEETGGKRVPEGAMESNGNSRHEKVTAQWMGRTTTNKIVNFDPPADGFGHKQGLTGSILNIMIEEAYPHSLRGRPKESDKLFPKSKGEKNVAA